MAMPAHLKGFVEIIAKAIAREILDERAAEMKRASEHDFGRPLIDANDTDGTKPSPGSISQAPKRRKPKTASLVAGLRISNSTSIKRTQLDANHTPKT